LANSNGTVSLERFDGASWGQLGTDVNANGSTQVSVRKDASGQPVIGALASAIAFFRWNGTDMVGAGSAGGASRFSFECVPTTICSITAGQALYSITGGNTVVPGENFGGTLTVLTTAPSRDGMYVRLWTPASTTNLTVGYRAINQVTFTDIAELISTTPANDHFDAIIVDAQNRPVVTFSDTAASGNQTTVRGNMPLP
jgi:hypothetical protein